MGYSKSPTTVNANWHLLKPLLTNQPEVVWSTANEEEAQRMAYKIRECFAIARRKHREMPQLASAATQYVITTLGTQVIARRLPGSEREALQDLETHLSHAPVFSPSTKIFPKAQTFEHVVQTWLDSGPAIEFIDSALSQNETNQVENWCANMVPELEILAAGKGFHIHIKGVSR